MNRALARHLDPEPIPTRLCMALAIYQYGATSQQLADFVRADVDSVSRRIRELVAAGRVRDSNIRDASRIIWELVKS